jgi:cyclophilin family peptidyl-prolyl cis-trans isomerase
MNLMKIIVTRVSAFMYVCLGVCVIGVGCAQVPASTATSTTTSTSAPIKPDTAAPAPKGYGDLLKASSAADWRTIDHENTVYLELAAGRVVMELSPEFAPNHVANIKALAREKYFDGLVIMRSQENYVAQWGDPTEKKMPIKAKKTLPAEFSVSLKKDLSFTRLPDVDGYAKEVGFASGFHAARDPKSQQMWLTHCYATLGVGRDNDPDSGGGTELYVVTGHAPRHLDRNITLVGRVVQGMSLLTTLSRGTGQLGFYEKPEQYVPIKSMRVAADVPATERSNLDIIRTDTPLFASLVEALRNRGGEWYKVPAGHIELCNMPIAVRDRAAQK